MMIRQACGVLVILAAACQTASAAEPLAVGDRACLLLDDHFIAEQTGLTRTWHQGQPHPKAIVRETEPWEHWICLWGSCFYDPVAKVYRMYYQSTLHPSGEPGISFRDYVLYAESKDGIEWVKPKLGQVEHAGSKDNNIVFPFAGPPNVFLDPKAVDSPGRIKAHIYFLKANPQYENARSMTLLQSDDGLRWKYLDFMDGPAFADPEQGGFVDIAIIGWDPLKNSYMAQWRTFSQHAVAEKPSGKRRALGITWSDRISRGWSPVVQTLKPDEGDDRLAARLSKDPAKPDFTEFYTMPHTVYGNHYLGFITLFELGDGRDGNGGGGLRLAFSNDGLRWTRPEPQRSAIANSDDPELFPNFAQFNPLLEMGDEVWLYYSENNGTHGTQPFAKSRGRIRAAVWRKDGFASLDATDAANLTTRPLKFSGDKLVINARVQEGGSLRVALLNEAGEPLPGFGLADCNPIRGDHVAKVVAWGDKTDLSSLLAKPLRLKFELERASLFSFKSLAAAAPSKP